MLNVPRSVAVGLDGSLYIADTGNHRVRRVAPTAPSQPWSGRGQRVPSSRRAVTGAPLHLLGSISAHPGLAIAPDGALYIADTTRNRIRKVGSNGIITTVAGIVGFCPPSQPCGDGGPAAQASLSSPSAVAVAPDGSFFIADTGSGRVRRVGPDGIVTTVAGTVSRASVGTADRPLERAPNPTGVALGPDGTCTSRTGTMTAYAVSLRRFRGYRLATWSSQRTTAARYTSSTARVATCAP